MSSQCVTPGVNHWWYWLILNSVAIGDSAVPLTIRMEKGKDVFLVLNTTSNYLKPKIVSRPNTIRKEWFPYWLPRALEAADNDRPVDLIVSNFCTHHLWSAQCIPIVFLRNKRSTYERRENAFFWKWIENCCINFESIFEEMDGAKVCKFSGLLSVCFRFCTLNVR